MIKQEIECGIEICISDPFATDSVVLWLPEGVDDWATGIRPTSSSLEDIFSNKHPIGYVDLTTREHLEALF